MKNQQDGRISGQELWRHLGQMVQAPPFARSPRLFALLRYLVRRTLTGEASNLKETVIAMEFYGKGSQYDPQFHSLVRVEMKRLRERLQEYYLGRGSDSRFFILLAPGDYTPRIVANRKRFRRGLRRSARAGLGSQKTAREQGFRGRRNLRYPKLRTAWASSS